MAAVPFVTQLNVTDEPLSVLPGAGVVNTGSFAACETVLKALASSSERYRNILGPEIFIDEQTNSVQRKF